jgi:hypothetical protein
VTPTMWPLQAAATPPPAAACVGSPCPPGRMDSVIRLQHLNRVHLSSKVNPHPPVSILPGPTAPARNAMMPTSLRSAFQTGPEGPATKVKLTQATGPSEERPGAGACLQYASVTLRSNGSCSRKQPLSLAAGLQRVHSGTHMLPLTRPVGRQLQQVWVAARRLRGSSAREDTPAPPSKPQPRRDRFLLLGLELDLFELCLLQSGICFAAVVFWSSHSTHW